MTRFLNQRAKRSLVEDILLILFGRKIEMGRSKTVKHKDAEKSPNSPDTNNNECEDVKYTGMFGELVSYMKPVIQQILKPYEIKEETRVLLLKMLTNIIDGANTLTSRRSLIDTQTI